MRNLRQTQPLLTPMFHRSPSAQRVTKRATSLFKISPESRPNNVGKSLVIVGALSALSFLGVATGATAQTTTTSATAASLLPAITTTTVVGIGVSTLPPLTATTIAGSALPTALTATQVTPSSTALSSAPTITPVPAPTIATPTLALATLAPVPLSATPVANTPVAQTEELPVGGVDAGQGGTASTSEGPGRSLPIALGLGGGVAGYAFVRAKRARAKHPSR